MTIQPPRHAHRRASGRSSRSSPAHVRVYRCGPTVYGPAHVGNFRVVPLRRPARPVPALARAPGHLGDEHHRRRRQDHPRRAARGGRRSTSSPSAVLERFLEDARVAPDDPPGRPAAGDRAHPGDGRADRDASSSAGHAYRDRRRVDLLPDRALAGVRPAGAPRPGAACASASASRPTSTRRTTSATSRSGRARRRASRVGRRRSAPGRPGLAHRVLGDEHALPRARRSTSTPAASTSSSRTTRTRSPSRRPRPGSRSSRTWLHCAHLQMGGEKMAKSDGQHRPGRRELVGAGVSPRALRYALLAAHYRMRRSSSARSRSGAATPAVDRLDAPGRRARRLPIGRARRPDAPARSSTRHAQAFEAALDDDLNDLARARRRSSSSSASSTAGSPSGRCPTADADAGAALAARPRPGARASCPTREALPAEPAALLEARAAAGPARDWAASDRLRDELAARGSLVEDTRDGQRWRRAGGAVGD